MVVRAFKRMLKRNREDPAAPVEHKKTLWIPTGALFDPDVCTVPSLLPASALPAQALAAGL
jgi:hypothetical protein